MNKRLLTYDAHLTLADIEDDAEKLNDCGVNQGYGTHPTCIFNSVFKII